MASRPAFRSFDPNQPPRARTAQAEAFVATAELVLNVDDEASPHVAAALAGIAPNGSDMSKDLARLLDIKDNAHYGGMVFVTPAQAGRAVQWARRMLTRAENLFQA